MVLYTYALYNMPSNDRYEFVDFVFLTTVKYVK